MKIKFKTRNIYRENVLISASPEADALFELLKPRQHLKPNELMWISKMGFEIEIIGDKRELNQEMKRTESIRTSWGKNSTMERHERMENAFHNDTSILFLKE